MWLNGDARLIALACKGGGHDLYASHLLDSTAVPHARLLGREVRALHHLAQLRAHRSVEHDPPCPALICSLDLHIMELP